MDERRHAPVRRAAGKLRGGVRRLRAGIEDCEHAFQFRHLRYVYLVPQPRSALEHQRETSPRHDSFLELHRRASRLRRVLEEGGVGSPDQRGLRAESERRRLLGSGRSVGSLGDLSPVRAERSQSLQLHRRRSMVSRPVAQPEGRVDRTDSVRRPRHRHRVPREDRSAVVPVLASRQG